MCNTVSHYRLSQNPEYRSLYYTVGTCFLSILFIVVCVCVCVCFNPPPHPESMLLTIMLYYRSEWEQTLPELFGF